MHSFRFKGYNKKNNYFEGWYIHLLDNDKNIAYAFIFGITLYEDDPHSFIQIIDKNNKEPHYFRYDVKDFYYNNESIKIKDNLFSTSKIVINEEAFNINLNINNLTALQNNMIMPGAMGIIKYLPISTHIEIIFLDAVITGKINDNDFSGSAYMEKNWGSCFPKKWIWMQSNNFKNSSTSFVIAYANLFNNIDGFFAILNINGEEFRFATYNGYKAKIIESNEEKIIIRVTKKDFVLKINLSYKDEYKLIAPTKDGNMNRSINESINSELSVDIYNKDTLVYSDTATNAACENTYYL